VEDTMTNAIEHLSQVILQAEMPGDFAEPTALLQALAALENPIAALSDHDQVNNLFAAFDTEFGFIRRARAGINPLQPSEQLRWASLVRWLIHELKTWDSSKDPLKHKLVAIFVAAHVNDWGGAFWESISQRIGDNHDLIQCLKGLIKSFAITFVSRGGVAEPIWEREAVEKFIVDDARGDWLEIGKGLRPLEHQILPNTLQTQSVRCLHRCSMDHLVDALTNLRQTLVAMQVASALPTGQRLRLAITSDNPYVQFGCIYLTLSGRQAARQHSSEEQQLLAALLLKVTNDAPRWIAWMYIFNAYPVRYPLLQEPLGHALAEAPDSAIEAYVDAIVLNVKPAKPDPNRRSATTCLRAFRARAAQDRRALLWRRAQERWSTWRFDEANPNTHLFAVNWSDLDYAVVAFACECMSDAERTSEMSTIRHELEVLDLRWYTSVTDIVSAWNRLLSRFQLYAHASHAMGTGEDWLPETKTYMPADLATNEYITTKYKVN
jgi:hypothetical protein